MMNEVLTQERLKYIIARLVENASEAAEESRADKNNEFAAGRKLAYYEMLDILKSELSVSEQDIKDLGIDLDLESLIA